MGWTPVSLKTPKHEEKFSLPCTLTFSLLTFTGVHVGWNVFWLFLKSIEVELIYDVVLYLLYSKVMQLYMFFFLLFPMLVYHRMLTTGPCIQYRFPTIVGP